MLVHHQRNPQNVLLPNLGTLIRARSFAAEGTTNEAHADFQLRLVHKAESLVVLLMGKMVQVERLGKRKPDSRQLADSENVGQKLRRDRDKCKKGQGEKGKRMRTRTRK